MLDLMFLWNECNSLLKSKKHESNAGGKRGNLDCIDIIRIHYNYNYPIL